MRKIAILFLFIISFFFLTLRPVSAAWITNTIYAPPINEYAQTPNMTLDSNNLGRIVYIQQDLMNPRIIYIQCTTRLCTSNTRVDTEITSSGRFSIIQGADELTRILHQNASYKLSLLTCTTPTCSSSVETLLSDTSNFNFTNLKYGVDGYLRIAYGENSGSNDLNYIQCQNDLCSSKIMTTIKTGNTSSFGFDMGSNGLAQFAYDDWSTARLYYARCNTDDCSDTTSTILDTGVVADEISPYSISLAVGTDNFARIAYILNDTLKFIQCTNQSCSTRSTTTLNGLTPSGSTLLKLGSDDLPKISTVLSSGSLNFISCSDQSCSSFSNEIIDLGPVNYQSDMNAIGFSLNAGNDGYLSYIDQTDWKLHFATNAPEPTATPTPTPTSIPSATPIPTAGPAGPRPDGERSTTDTPTCNERDLNETPDLFQITTSKTTATLYFSPISDVHKYYVSYGTTEGAEQYGTEFEYGDPSGVLSSSVNMLSPNQTYYFKVRGGRGCKAGAWGNVMKAKTTSGNAKQVFYKNIFSQIFTSLTNGTAHAQTNTVLGTSTKPKSCSYVVESGDSLWSIAQSVYSNGDLYTKLMKLNNLKNTTIHPGQKLKAC